eukprot:GCRY01001156.1.p1 GENE.GCRY01001156.1~~GCRY01001156.1.p1  ORF type:complete len:385 (+),score=64.90 GCRY01001156.1:268-1422(+)
MAGNIIREVWASNLEDEMAIIRDVVQRYPYVSMDTEYPGVIARVVGNFQRLSDLTYQSLRVNVDMTNLIQLGLTFTNEKGEMPKEKFCWQFNFKFDLNEEMSAQDSIDLLTKAGIDFVKHSELGCDRMLFAELFTISGLVFDENVRWISFHSGYDFAHLLKMLTCQKLPAEEKGFYELLHVFFPRLYDLKLIVRYCKGLKGGLQDIADDLKVERIGPQHQAGSDSLLTACAFFVVIKVYFSGQFDWSKFLGVLYGLTYPSTVRQQRLLSNASNPAPQGAGHSTDLSSFANPLSSEASTHLSSTPSTSTTAPLSNPPPQSQPHSNASGSGARKRAHSHTRPISMPAFDEHISSNQQFPQFKRNEDKQSGSGRRRKGSGPPNLQWK